MLAIYLRDQGRVDELKAENGFSSDQEVSQFLSQKIKAKPKKYEDLPRSVQLEIDFLVRTEIDPNVPRWTSSLLDMLLTINNGVDAIPNLDKSAYTAFVELEKAYLADDAEQFNSVLEAELAAVGENPPKEYSALKMKSEKFYNFFSPFFCVDGDLYYCHCSHVIRVGWHSAYAVRGVLVDRVGASDPDTWDCLASCDFRNALP